MPDHLICIISFQVQTSFQALPLGAACVASAIKADASLLHNGVLDFLDYSLEERKFLHLSDQAIGELVAKEISAKYADLNPSFFFVGFSAYVWNRLVIEYCAKKLRELKPNLILFAGGPEVTANPASWISSALHFLIPGEGERAVPLFIHEVLSGGIKTERHPIVFPIALPDLETLSSPWLDGTLQNCASFKEGRGALWELARGCPWKCAYCYESRGNKKLRTFPLNRLTSELEAMVSLGVERVFVLDPTYNADKKRALQILKLIEKKAHNLHFNFEVRAELIDHELAEAFSRIPCSLQIGLQSANPEVLKKVNRPTDLQVFKKKISILNKAELVFGFDLMYGLPGDSLTSFKASLDFALALYPNNVEIFRLSVLPGTDLFDKAADLALVCNPRPPYQVIKTDSCSEQELSRIQNLAEACDLFYTQGRAVSWFLSALQALRLKPSQFLQDFALFISAKNIKKNTRHFDIEEIQLEFLKEKFQEKKKAFLLPALIDVVKLNGAFTRALAEGEETRLQLSYHPEDVLSSDALDLEFFTENACMEHCYVRIFPGPEGPKLSVE